MGLHTGLTQERARFTVLHEIAHYILPHHQNRLYVCSDADLSFAARHAMEREANDVAADLLFLGDRFLVEANSRPLTAATVKALAHKYQASYEATARRLVEKSLEPCMLVVFERIADLSVIGAGQPGRWTVRYCVSSPAFRTRYFATVKGEVPDEIAAQVTSAGRDIADAAERELTVPSPAGAEFRLHAQFFYNSYNIFAFLRPLDAA